MSGHYGPRTMVGRSRLMTSNILNGMADAGHLAETLDRVRPDVIVTRGLGSDIADVITSSFPQPNTGESLRRWGNSLSSSWGSGGCGALT